MLARGPRVPARAVPTAGPASPRTASPTPIPRVCLAMGGSNPRAPSWPTHPKILKPGGGALASAGKSALAESAPPAGRSRAFAHLLPTPSTRPRPCTPPTRPRPPHPLGPGHPPGWWPEHSPLRNAASKAASCWASRELTPSARRMQSAYISSSPASTPTSKRPSPRSCALARWRLRSG